MQRKLDDAPDVTFCCCDGEKSRVMRNDRVSGYLVMC